MASHYRTIHPAKYYRDHLSYGIRPDGRQFEIFRPSVINAGSVTTANGSSVVKIGNTTVVCGIKAELAQPKAETPNEGYIIPNIDLPPLCSPKFRPGPPSDQAQVTSCLLADIIKNTKCIDLEDLCIVTDKVCWVLYCDMICVNHDGALTDACVLAVISALKTVKLPEVEYDPVLEIKTVNEENMTKLNVKAVPVASTFVIFDDSILADPTSEEENLCTGIVTVIVTDKDFCMVHKPGGSPLSDEKIEYCINESKNRCRLINELIVTAVNNVKE